MRCLLLVASLLVPYVAIGCRGGQSGGAAAEALGTERDLSARTAGAGPRSAAPAGSPAVPGPESPSSAAREETRVVGAASGAVPALSATIWKREVVTQEPILVKLQVTNPRAGEATIVAPYFNSYGRANFPLTLAVTDDAGVPVGNGWEGAQTGREPILRGRPWWIAGGPSAPGAPESWEWRAWRVPAGATVFMWYNLLQFYPLDEPGRYHITLTYDSAPDMLLSTGTQSPPADVVCWSAEIDAGWIIISQPTARDQAAATRLRECAEVQGTVFSTTFGWGRDAGLRNPDSGGDWLEGTSYEPYLEFARAFYVSKSASPQDAGGLPLADLLRVVGPHWEAARCADSAPLSIPDRLLAEPEKNAGRIKELRTAMRDGFRRSIEAQEAAVQVAREVGDYSLVGFEESMLKTLLYRARAEFPDGLS